MKKLKVLASISAFVMLNTFGLASYAAPVTVPTSEFGNFTYYINASGNGIGASTTITKPSSNKLLRTYEEMRDYANGTLIARDEDSGYGKSKAYTLLWKTSNRKVTAYATHEARGTGSIVRYTSTTL